MKLALIGATGLVGRQLWPLLEREHDPLVLGRRASGAATERLAPLEAWPALVEGERIDAAISALGTTRRKAGSWDAFCAVDRDAVLAFARAARRGGAQRMMFISSAGADAASRNAYLRLKGEVEEAVKCLGYPRIDILRPGLLLGERPGEHRLLERMGNLLDPAIRLVLRGRLDRFTGIPAGAVARAMAALLERHEPGLFRHHNREIRKLAGS